MIADAWDATWRIGGCALVTFLAFASAGPLAIVVMGCAQGIWPIWAWLAVIPTAALSLGVMAWTFNTLDRLLG